MAYPLRSRPSQFGSKQHFLELMQSARRPASWRIGRARGPLSFNSSQRQPSRRVRCPAGIALFLVSYRPLANLWRCVLTTSSTIPGTRCALRRTQTCFTELSCPIRRVSSPCSPNRRSASIASHGRSALKQSCRSTGTTAIRPRANTSTARTRTLVW